MTNVEWQMTNLLNGFDYILFFFDRIYRIYWIFYSLFPDERKNAPSPAARQLKT